VAVEKTQSTSKKFLAAMRFTRDWTVVIVLTLLAVGAAAYFMPQNPALATGMVSVLIAEIVVLGFVQVLYLGGQAAVDTFVRMAVVIVTGKSTVSSTPEPEETPPPEPTA
jgi:hypothetical protein